jgi:hypothetical protein
MNLILMIAQLVDQELPTAEQSAKEIFYTPTAVT